MDKLWTSLIDLGSIIIGVIWIVYRFIVEYFMLYCKILLAYVRNNGMVVWKVILLYALMYIVFISSLILYVYSLY
jgi:hypothetical protein